MFPPKMTFSEKVAEFCSFMTLILAIFAMYIAFGPDCAHFVHAILGR